MVIVELRDASGNILGVLTAQETEFSTGSTGLRANGKVQIDGAKYQCNVNIIKIGSKPAEKPGK